ncbi:hypothetical protein [Erysipelatoclostridium sp. An173]|uniref:hypothetical protein n=1 Tax=Erysipelatoclostridium sp. An173 TaxID=1965571 RepID=UPI0019513940|nr:hypothetical protein [Erysipelatoclostridium sp. An173]
MLNSYELEEIIDIITQKVILANRTGTLETLLQQWGLDDLLNSESTYETNKDGKIVVIGQTEVKPNVLQGIIKSLNLDKSRFEFCLDYNGSKTYNYKKLQYSPNYRVVMVGPIPHSSVGKNNSSSVIAEMKNKEGYPRIETLHDSNELKITKSNFKSTLEKLIQENYI